jgi:hypothetical protein
MHLRVICGDDAARMEQAKTEAEAGERAWLLARVVTTAEGLSLQELRFLAASADAVVRMREAG